MHYKYFKLCGYSIHYNHSNINKSDGVVVFIKHNVNKTSKVIEINRLKILHTIIKLSNNSNLEISALYIDAMICPV